MSDWKNDRGEMEMRKHGEIMMKKAREDSLLRKIEEFKSLGNDVDRWKWIFANKDLGFVIKIDNDDTYAYIENEDPDKDSVTLDFENYIGNGYGVYDMFEALGIKAEGV